jgi:hypothetical protein
VSRARAAGTLLLLLLPPMLLLQLLPLLFQDTEGTWNKY